MGRPILKTHFESFLDICGLDYEHKVIVSCDIKDVLTSHQNSSKIIKYFNKFITNNLIAPYPIV